MRFRWLLLLLVVTSCTSNVVDELAGDDDSFDDGKADDAGAFTYYVVDGSSAAMLNKSTKTAIPGGVDFAMTGLGADDVTRATTGAVMIVRGIIGGGTLHATELWVGPRKPGTGIVVKLRDADVRCSELACEIHDEIKLNSSRRARSGLLDFGSAIAAGDAANAQAAIGPRGLIIAGDRFTSGGVRGRTVDAMFQRVAPRTEWNVNDVSIMFPLPRDGEQDQLLRMTDGSGLWPEAAFKLFGDPATGMPFLIEGPGRDQLYPKLRVTSVRIDPCFDEPDPATATSCRRQVRLVAQPLEDSGAAFLDASIHLFYELDDAAFVKLLVAVRAVGLGGSGPAALGVHPTLAREGLRGPTATALRQALLDACRLDRLFKFTAMATGRSKNWFFFTLARQADGTFARVRGETFEGSFTDPGTPVDRQPVPTNDPAFPDELLATASVKSLSERGLLAGIDKLERLANPGLARTSETRCASCHAAATTLEHVLALNDVAAGPRTASSWSPLAFVPVDERNGFSNHHAFSYLGDQPTVNRRVVNDSVATARFLSSAAFLDSLDPSLRAQLE